MASSLKVRADALVKITDIMGKTQQNLTAEEERYQKIVKKPNYSLSDSEKSKQKIAKLKMELAHQHPETYDIAYTRWLLAHPSFPGGKLPSLPMEVKDMIASYFLTRRIKQIEDQVKNKPEIKAKQAKK